MTDLAKLVARLELQSSQFQSELEKTNRKLLGFQRQAKDSLGAIEKQFTSFGKGFAALLLPVTAGAVGAGVARFIGSAVNLAKETKDAAERAGVLASEMSRLAFIADDAGVSTQSLEQGLKRYQRTLSEAANGNTQAAESLSKFGLEARSLRQLSLEDQFAAIADGLADVAEHTDRVTYLSGIFGDKLGADLVPLFGKGAAGIKEMADQADRLGITLDDRAVQSLDRSTKALEKFWRAVKGGTANYIGDFVADTFGSGDDLLDAQAKLEKLIATRDRLLQSTGGRIVDTPALRDIEQQILAYEVMLGAVQRVKSAEEAAAAVAAGLNQDRSAAINLLNADIDAFNKSVLDGWEKEKKAHEERLKYLADVDKATAELTEEWDRHYKRLDEMTKTSVQRDAEALREKLEATETLLAAGLITYEDYVARRQEILDEALPEIKVTHKKILDDSKQTTDTMTEYWRESMRNTQNILADFLYDPFKDGLDGMLRAFVDMLRRMAAEAAAAKIAESIFGREGSGNGGVFGAVLGAFGIGAGGGSSGAATGGGEFWDSIAAGSRANGGPVSAGKLYRVNENGMEYFKPNVSGAVIPMGSASAGGDTIQINMPIDARGATVEAIQLLPAVQKAAVNEALARVQQMRRRGRL